MQLGASIPGTWNSYREQKTRMHPQARVAPVDANQIGLLHGTYIAQVDRQVPFMHTLSYQFNEYAVHFFKESEVSR